MEIPAMKSDRMLRLHNDIIEAYKPRDVSRQPIRQLGGLSLYQGATDEVIEARSKAKEVLIDASVHAEHVESVLVALDEIATNDSITAFYLAMSILKAQSANSEQREVLYAFTASIIESLPDHERQEAMFGLQTLDIDMSMANEQVTELVSVVSVNQQHHGMTEAVVNTGSSYMSRAIESAAKGQFANARSLQSRIEDAEERDECSKEIDRYLYTYADSEATLGHFPQARHCQARIEDENIKEACSVQIDKHLAASADAHASEGRFPQARHCLARIEHEEIKVACSLIIDRHLMAHAIRLAMSGRFTAATINQQRIMDSTISSECDAAIEELRKRK